MKNGQPYPDTAGNPIHAHGGWMLDYDGYTYWYGEDRRDNHYAAVYRSPSDDMKNWEFRGHILSTDTPARETSARFDLTLSWEKDGHTGKAHYENGEDYREARACVASSDFPDRDFVYHGSFNPFGEMSRDCTVHTDAAGDAYFVSASRDNADLHIYRLTEDYLNVGEWVKSLYCHEFR